MDFKDLCKFNEAMLAKQVWRLVHDTRSLFYKVFKAKYFPNGSMFDAKVSSGSFASFMLEELSNKEQNGG